MTQLRIRILRCPGVETAVETVVATRFFRGALAPYQYIYVSARFETAVETVFLEAH